MADGEVELKTQEIVFVGNLYLYPNEILRYGQFLDNNKILTTEPAKSIWRKLHAYYSKYDNVPSWDTMGSVFTEKEVENLTLGIEIAEEDESRAQFILDSFTDTMQMIVYKKAVADMEKVMETGSNSLDRAIKLSKVQEIERWLGSTLNVVRRAGNNLGTTNKEIIGEWAEGKLPFQQPLVPIPIDGMEFVEGSPIGTVNVVVGAYGTGKTSTLCSMAANLSGENDTLYVTLETHSNAIAFKIAAAQTDGKVPAKMVFVKPEDIKDKEAEGIVQAIEDKVASKHNIYILDALPGELTASGLESYARNLMRQYQIKLSTIFVDYTALMKTNSGGGQEEVGWGYTGTIITELSAVAKALELTIWTVAQSGGEGAHTITYAQSKEFKPIRGGQLYGSKTVLHDASMAFGLAILRSNKYSRLGVGVLSTIKNRYGEKFLDYICDIDYAKSKVKVLGFLKGLGEGEIIEAVQQRLQQVENDYILKLNLNQKKKIQDELDKFAYSWSPTGGHKEAKEGAAAQKQTPKAKPAANPADSGDSQRSSY